MPKRRCGYLFDACSVNSVYVNNWFITTVLICHRISYCQNQFYTYPTSQLIWIRCALVLVDIITILEIVARKCIELRIGISYSNYLNKQKYLITQTSQTWNMFISRSESMYMKLLSYSHYGFFFRRNIYVSTLSMIFSTADLSPFSTVWGRMSKDLVNEKGPWILSDWLIPFTFDNGKPTSVVNKGNIFGVFILFHFQSIVTRYCTIDDVE